MFEAPIDLLSFLSLYPENWQGNSYITLNGVAEHAMPQALKDNPRLDTVVLCLDHDPAGIEACGRLAEILVRNGYGAVKRLQSACKDWNEDLKGRYGEETIPAQEHPESHGMQGMDRGAERSDGIHQHQVCQQKLYLPLLSGYL